MSIAITGKTQAPSNIPPAAREPGPAAAGPKDASPAPKGDKVTLSSAADPPITYDKPRPKMPTSAADLTAILEQSENEAKKIMNLILPLVEQQGLNLAKVVSGEQKLTVDQATIDKAKAAIGEDGEFGVKQVAERILNFVKGVAGDDPAKLASMRAAVEDGFKQAADMLGGTLPEISEQTREVIMDTFDRWASAGTTAQDSQPA